MRAGLLPELAHWAWPDTDLVGAAVFIPGDTPMAAFEEALARARASLEGLPGSCRRLVIVVDQFETLLTGRAAPDARKAFVARLVELAQAAAGEVFVIVTSRSDFLGALQDHPELEALTGHEGALPLLQYTLTRIWEGMAKGIAPEAYFDERLDGSIARAIASEADRLLDKLDDDRRKAITRRAFVRMVELHEQTLLRHPVSLHSLVGPDETEAEVLDVLRHFAERRARMVTLAGGTGSKGQANGDVVASVTHEALITMNRPGLPGGCLV